MDIEDLSLARVQKPSSRVEPPSQVVPSGRRVDVDLQSFEPAGVAHKDVRIFVKSYGCSHNTSDAEYMMGILDSAGYSVTRDFDTADGYLINGCTVKGPSELHFANLLARAKALKRPVVVSGCVPQAELQDLRWSDVSIVGTGSIDRVAEAFDHAFEGAVVRYTTPPDSKLLASLPSLKHPKLRMNRWIEIIPISSGCLSRCTYCKTKHARGELRSYTVDDIVSRLKQAIEVDGVIEVRLTSEDTGAWGRDLGLVLGDLLRAVMLYLSALPPTCPAMVRFGMTNPPYMHDALDDIIAFLRHPRVFSFVHVPVQAGSDSVLRDMRREYTAADFDAIVDAMRAGIPDLTVATDVICGFPTESAEDFEASIALVQRHKPPMLYISQMYQRPGTPAALLRALPSQVVKERSRKVTKVFESYQTLERLVGKRVVCVVSEDAADGYHLVGHTKSFTQVLVRPATRSGGKAQPKLRKPSKKGAAVEGVDDGQGEDDAKEKGGEWDAEEGGVGEKGGERGGVDGSQEEQGGEGYEMGAVKGQRVRVEVLSASKWSVVGRVVEVDVPAESVEGAGDVEWCAEAKGRVGVSTEGESAVGVPADDAAAKDVPASGGGGCCGAVASPAASGGCCGGSCSSAPPLEPLAVVGAFVALVLPFFVSGLRYQ